MKCNECKRLKLHAEEIQKFFTFGKKYGIGITRHHKCREFDSQSTGGKS